MIYRQLIHSFRKTPGLTQFNSMKHTIFPAQSHRYFSTSGEENQLLLSLSSPTECQFKNQSVSSVTLPGVDGEFTITPQHSPFVTFIRNGVITVRPINTTQESQFFVSDGLCLVHGPTEDNSNCKAEVLGIEMVPLEFLDKEKTVQVLQDLLQSSSGSNDEWEKTKSLLGQELCSAILRSAP